ncbi:MAG: hypothetical protein K2H86_06040 [Muribaculaceae bacterium]|nr:hypothetical protein [Muribaculaceae bacterium]
MIRNNISVQSGPVEANLTAFANGSYTLTLTLPNDQETWIHLDNREDLDSLASILGMINEYADKLVASDLLD